MFRFLLLFQIGCFSSFALADELDCAKATTTLEINECASQELKQAGDQMQRYLLASIEQYAGDTEITDSIKSAQAAWKIYRERNCDSVYGVWKGGSIRGVMSISCRTNMTQARTHELWQQYLTYADNSEPVLPEPDSEVDKDIRTGNSQ